MGKEPLGGNSDLKSLAPRDLMGKGREFGKIITPRLLPPSAQHLHWKPLSAKRYEDKQCSSYRAHETWNKQGRGGEESQKLHWTILLLQNRDFLQAEVWLKKKKKGNSFGCLVVKIMGFVCCGPAWNPEILREVGLYQKAPHR